MFKAVLLVLLATFAGRRFGGLAGMLLSDHFHPIRQPDSPSGVWIFVLTSSLGAAVALGLGLAFVIRVFRETSTN